MHNTNVIIQHHPMCASVQRPPELNQESCTMVQWLGGGKKSLNIGSIQSFQFVLSNTFTTRKP